MMIDLRKIHKEASILVNQREKLIFRHVLKNGMLVERIISPVAYAGNQEHCLYSHVRIEYKPKKDYKINNIYDCDKSKMIKINKYNHPSVSSEHGVITNVIEDLLRNGYVLYESSKVETR